MRGVKITVQIYALLRVNVNGVSDTDTHSSWVWVGSKKRHKEKYYWDFFQGEEIKTVKV